jgi:hypothetical protein
VCVVVVELLYAHQSHCPVLAIPRVPRGITRRSGSVLATSSKSALVDAITHSTLSAKLPERFNLALKSRFSIHMRPVDDDDNLVNQPGGSS